VSNVPPNARLIAAIVLAVAVGTVSRNVNAADIRHVVQDHAFGCRDTQEYLKLVEFAHDGDNEAFEKIKATAFLSGECAPLPQGGEVFVIGVISMWAQVRLRGSTRTLWTNKEAVSPSN
jgi:hypothetical protein